MNIDLDGTFLARKDVRFALMVLAALIVGSGTARAEQWPNLDPEFVVHPLHSVAITSTPKSC